MDLKFFQMLDLINNRLTNIEKNISRIEEKVDFSITLQRNHLIRVKNGQEIDDSMILYGRPYNDITPQRAFEIYNNPDIDFILLDVTSADFKPPGQLDGAIHIPLEELKDRYHELPSQTATIMIISEKGLRSIKACEILVQKGFFNVNNISGGYLFWPGFKGMNKTAPEANS